MAGKTLDLSDIIQSDQLATEIARIWHDWDTRRSTWKAEKQELRQYVFATDTMGTSNAVLPWTNKTHIPKLCQIRDNLVANYMASMFPKRKWLFWEGSKKADEDRNKVEASKDYMTWVISQKEFKEVIAKLVNDYIDYGNVLATSEWVDETTVVGNQVKPSYVGPRPVRLNPLDTVMNPIAPTAKQSPKIIRTLWTLGEAKQFIEAQSATEEQKITAQEIWKYLMNVRDAAANYGGDYQNVDDYMQIDGFSGWKEYLGSNYVEMLSFYGDFYDKHDDKLYKNQVIHVLDRHKIIYNEPHSAPTGDIPIHHCGWRVRQDNIWAMGPLDNLVGMQYRIDHVENAKADIFDLTIYPPIKIKGMVEDFDWGPFERIYVDNDGDVELMSPKADILTANVEIQSYEQRMEEMAGSPKEAMGFRSPGEKTAYEVQRLENAASRIFQAKIKQFEEQILEPLLNDMLALARENLTSATIRVIDSEFKSVGFKSLTREDLSVQGRIKPVAARHFAERAELVQNLTNFYSSGIGQDPTVMVHFSGKKIAEMVEEILGIEDYELFQEYVRLDEQQEAQKLSNAGQEQTALENATPAGIAQDDFQA